ncbi:MAG: class I SAM-dependent methyltransferase [Clostridiales bacterium]|nr:class I SAM-dependent methyltransferase [Clostridiales bacterium]
MSAYEGLARYYDALTGDVDYDAWLSWYLHWFEKSRVPVHLVLDLCCGTGTLTCMLAQKGYSTIGTDLSADMLSEAMEKSFDLALEEPPLLLNQSASQLDLYGTVDTCVCSLDSLNYVTDEGELREAFRRLHTFLVPEGYFLFDVLAPQWMEGLDGQIFVDETEDVLCLWRASFEGETLTYGMDLFERDGNVWRREQEEHRERAWQPAALEAMLREAGFARVQVFGGMEERPPESSDGRLFFVCTNGDGEPS